MRHVWSGISFQARLNCHCHLLLRLCWNFGSVCIQRANNFYRDHRVYRAIVLARYSRWQKKNKKKTKNKNYKNEKMSFDEPKIFSHKTLSTCALGRNSKRALMARVAWLGPNQGPKVAVSSSPAPSCLHRDNISFCLCTVYSGHTHITWWMSSRKSHVR